VIGATAEVVTFVDMHELGSNPARIIPAWRQFVSDRSRTGRWVRCVGEPIWPGRGAAEIVESQRHEELLNLAFGSEPIWLLCPYDVSVLAADLVAEAWCSHPRVIDRRDGLDGRPSRNYRGAAAIGVPFAAVLEPVPLGVAEVAFDRAALGSVRRRVARTAEALGLDLAARDELALAAHEVAANCVEHGGGAGSFRVWLHAASVIVEVRDDGCTAARPAPLAGWELPLPGATGGRGLWMANQVSDLVQIRSASSGTIVRLHRRLPPSSAGGLDG
jgi:anti-sigma regulatory factor (Ser/Thr protein kinase)